MFHGPAAGQLHAHRRGARRRRDGLGGLGLGLRRPGLPHGVGVVDLGLRVAVVRPGLDDGLRGLPDEGPGLRRELHGLGALDRVLGALDLHGAVPGLGRTEGPGRRDGQDAGGCRHTLHAGLLGRAPAPVAASRPVEPGTGPGSQRLARTATPLVPMIRSSAVTTVRSSTLAVATISLSAGSRWGSPTSRVASATSWVTGASLSGAVRMASATQA